MRETNSIPHQEVITIVQSNNGNGQGPYEPSKTWEILGEDTWFEADEEVPGQERIVDSQSVKDGLENEDETPN